MVAHVACLGMASWAGICPGNNESAGKIKSTKIPPGNRYLKAALGTAAMVALRDQNSYLGARYRRIKARRGAQRALVALEHSILTAIWHMAATGEVYTDREQRIRVFLAVIEDRHVVLRTVRQCGGRLLRDQDLTDEQTGFEAWAADPKAYLASRSS